MGQLDNQPDGRDRAENGAAHSLKEITRELESLKHNVIDQLSQEIDRLQRRKALLLRETEQLELQRQQQIEQHQELARQIAPALAHQLQELLRQQLRASGPESGDRFESPVPVSDYNKNANRAIASLDSTLRTTFKTLQQDLSSYQSALSQQLGQMYSLEQQGAAILETLVSRLRDELEAKIAPAPPQPPIQQPLPSPTPLPSQPSREPQPHASQPISPPPQRPAPSHRPPAKTVKKPKASEAQLGFALILLYSLALSLQNVVIRIIVKNNPSDIFGGWLKLGSYISPSLGNSVLLLMLRMIFVVVGMAILAGILYPRTWQDIKKFVNSGTQMLWLKVIGSGFFLFLSQVLIYIAFGSLSAGVALTIFFIFPIVTVLLSWLFFGERPSLIRSLATAAVVLGVALIAFASGGQVNFSITGIAAAVGAGITFAFYVLLIQAGAKAIHPIPLSVINFATIFAFSLVSLLIPAVSNSINVRPDMWTEVWVCGLVLGGLSLLSYLVNNIGISLIGAARAAIFGATGPAFTALLALLIIGEGLNFQEFWGMAIVTAGVAAVSAERFLKKLRPKKR